MDFENQLKCLSEDVQIHKYFEKRNLYDFVKMYIEVDKLLDSNRSCESKSNLNDKLDMIKQTIDTNNSQLSNVFNSIGGLKDTINMMREISNNDLKIMFGELQQLLLNGLDTQNIRIILDNFKDKIETLNSQKLNEFDRKTLDMLTGIQTSMGQSLDTHPIYHKITSIETNLTTINEHFSSNSSKKGQLAEGVLYNVLTDTFPDAEILDTSNQANSGDLQIVKDDKPRILIDSKHFESKTVPKRDLDKFYADIQTNNCSGILCNAFGGIANKQHFEIDIVDRNVLIFIHSHKFDRSIFELAVNIIYNMHEQIKHKQQDSIIIDQRLFQNLKIEYNYYIQTFRHHLDIIKSNVNALSQLSFTLIDNFFKRKASTTELKAFVCHLCGTGCKTEKILKTHIKKIHQPTSVVSLKMPELPNRDEEIN